MKGSIVEFTPMNLEGGKTAEEKIGLIIDAINKNSSDLKHILYQLENRIKALEKK